MLTALIFEPLNLQPLNAVAWGLSIKLIQVVILGQAIDIDNFGRI